MPNPKVHFSRMSEAENKLIEELKAGKDEAYDAFLAAFGDRLYSFASRMCRNTEDAKDVVQETLISVFKSLKDFRGESRFRTWLYTIAANACRKMKRKGKFEPSEELSLDEFMPTAHGDASRPEIADWSQNPESLFLQTELRSEVEAAIAGLPPPYRIVLILRDIEQLTTEETAQALALSPEAVKSRLHRARLFVRERLSNYWRGPTKDTK
jgi:RNA polymerase sigma-70 factor (ECF subfamily)